MNLLLHTAHDGLRRNGSAKFKESIRNKVLCQRNVKIRLSCRRYEKVLPVSRDADDFNERSCVALQTKILSYGIFVRPETFRHGLVHNRNGWRRLAVRICEQSSLHERNLHGLKVSRADGIVRDYRRSLVRWHRTALHKNGGCVTWAPHRHGERHACGLHPGYSANFAYQLLVKSRRLSLIVAEFMGIHDGIQYVIGIESEIHMLSRIETPNKQSGRNQQH